MERAQCRGRVHSKLLCTQARPCGFLPERQKEKQREEEGGRGLRMMGAGGAMSGGCWGGQHGPLWKARCHQLPRCVCDVSPNHATLVSRSPNPPTSRGTGQADVVLETQEESGLP